MNMENEKREKILLACDGSDRFLKTTRYVSKFKMFSDFHLVLFHVFRNVPKSYWDLERNPKNRSSQASVKAWEYQNRKNIEEKMDKAKQILLHAGFQTDAVTSIIRDRDNGVAMDILKEARKGYRAVVIRRRGMTALRGITLGSVAAGLVEKLDYLPLIIIGKMPPASKILLAMDGSESNMRAVEFVGAMLGRLDVEAKMIFVIRGNSESWWHPDKLETAPVFNVSTEAEAREVFEKAKRILVDSGFKKEKISSIIVTGVSSRAKAIAEEAQKGGYSTIAMGRTGLTRSRISSLGTVPNKVIRLARQHSVWVVP